MAGRVRRLVLSVTIAAVSSLVAVGAEGQRKPAGPTDKDVCATAYDLSQQLRDAGRLRLARAQLVVCQAACPATLTPDCDKWRAEIEATIPSVQLVARDAGGHLISEVRVSVDGKLVATRIGIDPIEVDPGPRVFVFEAAGGRAELLVEVKPGVTGQRVVARLDGTTVASRPAGPPPDEPTNVVPLAKKEPPMGAIVLGAAGGVALVVGGVLAVKGHVDRGELYDCKPRCPQSDIDAIRATWTVAGLSAAVGGVAVGGAVAWWMLDRHGVFASSPAVSWVAGRSGAQVGVVGRF